MPHAQAKERPKSRTIAAIEAKLEAIDPASPRGQCLELARQFKSHWIELGQMLTRVLNEQLFTTWGFATFDRYVTGELKLRKETAYKLVRSFSFVEERKPEFLAPDSWSRLPAVETVDLLARLGKEPHEQEDQFRQVTDSAFEETWSPRLVNQRWREAVGDQQQAEKRSDPATRAVARARELVDRLNRALIEIPGIDPKALDAIQSISKSLGDVAP